jgi:hypothetical protein
MGTMTFQLPPSLPAPVLRELGRACIAGGPDNMPWPSEVNAGNGRLTVRRTSDDSGYLAVPWEVDGAGLLMGTTATLMERPQPYQLQLELARGKVNQLRCQAADWIAGGLVLPDDLSQRIRQATLSFGRAVTQPLSDAAGQQAQEALTLACAAAHDLVRTYVQQVFEIRHQRSAALDTALGVPLAGKPPEGEAGDALRRACNAVRLPLPWHAVEPGEGRFLWEPHDALVDWALRQGLAVSAGPLIDFSSARLPDWLWLWERDLSSLASFMCTYVETAVRRYRGRVRRWQLSTASNCARVLSLGEDELLWLTVRLAETARQVDPGLELVVGIAQPWGEYMAAEERMHSPFIFADTLIRTGLNLGALDLELVMGVTPRGSYSRDLLETSRLLDLYSLLGVPVTVTLGYPSATGADHLADPDLGVDAGRWREGPTLATQAGWAAAFTGLAAAKPYVQAVHWAHWSDAEPHAFPHCGLVEAGGQVKPALQPLQELRINHLR